MLNYQHNLIAKITASISNYNSNIYHGTSEGTFKLRYGNHTKSFCREQHRKDTELYKEYWRLQKLNASPEIEFSILGKFPPNRRKGACYLCLCAKRFIIKYKDGNLLNQQSCF